MTLFSSKARQRELALPKITAKEIVALLAERHKEDLFVPECKDGPTQAGTHLRMDAWAMKRSWANPNTFGYEVKVNRGDFLNDQKWPGYLGLCNQFNFVCPAGVIRPDEVGEGVGLLWVASTGKMLVTKKKALWRDVEIPESLWRYIAMCRTKIVDADSFAPRSRVAYFRQWLAEKREGQTLGYEVAQRIRDIVEDVRRENDRLKSKHAQYDDIRAALVQLGWNDADNEWIAGYSVEAKLRKLREIVTPDVEFALERAAESLHKAVAALSRARQGNKAESTAGNDTGA